MNNTDTFNEALRAAGVEIADPLKMDRLLDTAVPVKVFGLDATPEDDPVERIDAHTAYCPVLHRTVVGTKVAVRFVRHFFPDVDKKGDPKEMVRFAIKHCEEDFRPGDDHRTMAWGFGYEFGFELGILFVK